MTAGDGTVEPPGPGMWRVHPHPDLLPRKPKFEEGEVAQSRFDDPAGVYRVRYAASSLRGCLLEVLAASFRVREPLEERIGAITNAEPVEGDLVDLGEPKELEAAGRVPPAWLGSQRVARLRAKGHSAYLDAMDAWFLARNNRHPRIRRALTRHLGELYDLDAATILLNLEHSRPVTQAVSAVIWGEMPDASGIRYLSRLDLSEECWAIFDRTPVEFDPSEPLNRDNMEHREGLQSAAALLELALPDEWRD